MNKHKFITKLKDLKNNFQKIFNRKKTFIVKNDDENFDQYLDDLPLTINRDPGPEITFYNTENSEYSRGMRHGIPKNIDSFAEK